ncbi:MAG: aminomethyl-transferring glycine dehydrogenase subunit GcvPA [Clostridiales bacterium]|nr:aminomethyl-transferring glycine dehydrogenase subunit GcvPA [Clostridiales bacterium]
MHRYIPNTESEKKLMMEQIGIQSIDDLFSSIPEEIRHGDRSNLPPGMSEQELIVHMRELAMKNISAYDLKCFLGAGTYDHFIPAVVGALTSRSEFYTAYTPYQAEISQGVLQAIFEYQSMVCELTGMEAANASMYDGVSATAEACAIALVTARKRNKIIVSGSVLPETREVIKTYMNGRDVVLLEIPFIDGETDYEALKNDLDDNTAAVCIQSPNFFGIIEDIDRVGEMTKDAGAAMIVNTDLISLGILKPPSEAGADFVVGDAQPLGNPMAFGGPHLGFFATSGKYIRKMPGRIVGETVDTKGDKGYVLTLQTREQHIRREKATSNICSNHALNALASTIYMSLVGKEGIKEVALRCANNARYTREMLLKTGKFSDLFGKPFFKEFAVKADTDIKILNEDLHKLGYIGGLNLEKKFPWLEGGWLIAVTEKRTKVEIDDFTRKAGDAV